MKTANVLCTEPSWVEECARSVVGKMEEEHKFYILPEKFQKYGYKLLCKSIKHKTRVSDAIELKEQERRGFNTQLHSLLGWFIRASHAAKWKFLQKLMDILKEGNGLVEIVNAIGHPPKDLIYAISQYTNNAYDRTPLDSNRSLNDTKLFEAQNIHHDWFSHLYELEQIHIVLGLLEVCGSSMAYRFYTEAVKILNEQVKETDKSEVGLAQSRGHRTIPKTVSVISDVDSTNTSLQTIKKLLEKKLKDWNMKMVETVTSKHPAFRRYGYAQPKVKMDKLQMLPVWINRYIFSLLDPKAREKMSTINHYWKLASLDFHKEKSVANWRNKTCRKFEVKLMERGLSFSKITVGSKPQKKSAPTKKLVLSKGKSGGSGSYTSDKDKVIAETYLKNISEDMKGMSSRTSSKLMTTPNQDFASLSEEKRAASIEALLEGQDSPFFARVPITQFLKKHKKFTPTKSPYHGSYHVSIIHSSYMFNRKITASENMIAITNDNEVIFLNLLTGAPLNFKFIGHTADISTLMIDPSGRRVITGSLDMTVKLWSTFSNDAKTTYLGSEASINSVSMNNDYVVSSSIDSTVKAFRINTGECVETLKLEHQPTIVHIDNEHNVIIATSSGKLLRFFLFDYGKSKTRWIDFAHDGDVICMSVKPPLLVSGGIDGFVRVWDSNFNDKHWMVSLNHKWRVNGLFLSFMTILTAAEDGKLRIWDLQRGSLQRIIDVNITRRPLVDMVGLEFHDHAKVIINCEDVIKVYEFPYKWVKAKDFCKLKGQFRYRVSKFRPKIRRTLDSLEKEKTGILEYIEDPYSRKSNKDKRLEDLSIRYATLPAMLKTTKKQPLAQDPPIVALATTSTREIFSHPRYLSQPKITRGKVTKADENWAIPVEEPLYCTVTYTKRKPSLKGILSILNPTKDSI